MRWLSLWVLAGCAPRLYTEGTDADDTSLTEGWQAPTNDWPVNPPPAELVAEGFGEGQVALDIRGLDAAGDTISLWQFYGQTVLVDISTMWCSPCQDLGVGTEHTYQSFKDEGFIYLTVLHEDVDNEPPDSADLQLWSGLPATHPDPSRRHDAITAPIIADPDGISGSIQAVQANIYPVLLLVGPDMRVEERIEPVTEAHLEDVLDLWFHGTE